MRGFFIRKKKREYEDWLLQDMRDKKQQAEEKVSNGATAEETVDAFRETWKAIERVRSYRS